MQLTLLIAAVLTAGPGHEGHDHPTGETCCTAGGAGQGCAPGAASEGQAGPYRDAETWREHMRQQLASPPAHVEPPDPDPFAFSTFRGVRPEPMGSETLIGGAVMRIASLTVDLPPHEVERYYLDSFAKAQVAPMRGVIPNTRGVRYLSYRPPGSKNLKTLTLIPAGPGTVVMASVGDPSPMVESPRVDFPRPPGAERGVYIQQSEGGAANRTHTFRVRGVTAPQVRDFYRRELAARGFSREQGGAEAETFTNGPNLVSISLHADREPGAVVVNVVWLR